MLDEKTDFIKKIAVSLAFFSKKMYNNYRRFCIRIFIRLNIFMWFSNFAPLRAAFRRKRPSLIFNGGERSIFMFKEFTETAVAKAKEDISVPQGIIVLIAVASFVTGLIIGIVCASGAKASRSRKIKKSSFRAEDYSKDLDFDDEDDEGF